jgi:hypothetical protein
MSRLAEEKDPEILRKAVDLLERHNRVLSKKLAAVLRELERTRAELAAATGNAVKGQLRLEALEQQLAKLTKQIFGTSSEKRADEEQADAGAEGEDKNKDEKKKGSTTRLVGAWREGGPGCPTVLASSARWSLCRASARCDQWIRRPSRAVEGQSRCARVKRRRNDARGQRRAARRACVGLLWMLARPGSGRQAVLVGTNLSTGSREIPEQQRKIRAIRLLAEWKP